MFIMIHYFFLFLKEPDYHCDTNDNNYNQNPDKQNSFLYLCSPFSLDASCSALSEGATVTAASSVGAIVSLGSGVGACTCQSAPGQACSSPVGSGVGVLVSVGSGAGVLVSVGSEAVAFLVGSGTGVLVSVGFGVGVLVFSGFGVGVPVSSASASPISLPSVPAFQLQKYSLQPEQIGNRLPLLSQFQEQVLLYSLSVLVASAIFTQPETSPASVCPQIPSLPVSTSVSIYNFSPFAILQPRNCAVLFPGPLYRQTEPSS